MDWWLILLIFLVIVLIVWWALSRQTTGVEAAHHEAAEVHEESPAKSAAVAKDDLTKIEGIGPKVQGLLNEAGIHTYAELADKTPEQLDEVLDAAGSIYKAMDETSWPRQARLAAAGDWEALEKLQDELIGGK